MGGIKDALKIVEKTSDELEQIKSDVKKAGLPEETVTMVMYGLNLIMWLPKLILEQKITLFRLKELLFGKGARKRLKKSKSKGFEENNEPDPANQNNTSSIPFAANEEILNQLELETTNIDLLSEGAGTKEGRTGRIPHTDYLNAIEHNISIEDFEVGEPCPLKCGGNLYRFRPSTIIRIKGNQTGCAHRYIIEKLRCNLCGEIISAKPPKDLGDEKYDANFIAQLGIQKYYLGLPSYRQDCFHSFIDLPLPHTTQWMLLEKLAGVVIPIFNELCKQAAQSSLIYYDDTPVKIVDEIRDNRINPDKKRKGMFTTGILAKFEGYQIILYFNGMKHAGENIDKLLSKRTCTSPVMLMSDALSRNIPKYKNII